MRLPQSRGSCVERKGSGERVYMESRDGVYVPTTSNSTQATTTYIGNLGAPPDAAKKPPQPALAVAFQEDRDDLNQRATLLMQRTPPSMSAQLVAKN